MSDNILEKIRNGVIDSIALQGGGVQITGVEVKPEDIWSDENGVFHYLTVTMRIREPHTTA